MNKQMCEYEKIINVIDLMYSSMHALCFVTLKFLSQRGEVYFSALGSW